MLRKVLENKAMKPADSTVMKTVTTGENVFWLSNAKCFWADGRRYAMDGTLPKLILKIVRYVLRCPVFNAERARRVGLSNGNFLSLHEEIVYIFATWRSLLQYRDLGAPTNLRDIVMAYMATRIRC